MPSLLSPSFLLLVLFYSSDGCIRITPCTNGIPVNPCKSCAQSLITKSQNGQGSHSFDSDITSTTGDCAVRTFTCKGVMANIERMRFNIDRGTISDGGTGTAVIEVTCNADGSAWMAEETVVTNVECASHP